MVKKTCVCTTNDINPAGIPKFNAINSTANCPRAMNRPYKISQRQATCGLPTKNTSGTAAIKKRQPESANGGTVCNEILMETKVSPQIVAMASAKRLWRSGIDIELQERHAATNAE